MAYKNVTQAVILAGGKGTRISEETHNKPKPMIEIGNMPILWHIMKTYYHYGIKEFIICLGYKGYQIKEYFLNYAASRSDVILDMSKPNQEGVVFKGSQCEDWKITLVDTGMETMTGGRIKRIKEYLNPDQKFCLTYGDGVSDLNIRELIDFHDAHNALATVTAVRPIARFGALELAGTKVTTFIEKPKSEGGYVSGGYFVLAPEVIDYIKNDDSIFEQEALENLAADNQLQAYLYNGFWHPMDTLRDHTYLSDLWSANKAPWKIW